MKASLLGYPAYGRQYKTQEALREAFLTGKDFSASVRGGPYFSIRDFTQTQFCNDFDGVILAQPDGQRGTLCAAAISRSEMCDYVKQVETKLNTSGSPTGSGEGTRPSSSVKPGQGNFPPSVKPAVTCEQERKHDE